MPLVYVTALYQQLNSHKWSVGCVRIFLYTKAAMMSMIKAHCNLFCLYVQDVWFPILISYISLCIESAFSAL